MKSNEQIKQELEKEYEELNKKYLKLDNFGWTEEFKQLPQLHQDLLNLQNDAMNSYCYILQMRIKNL